MTDFSPCVPTWLSEEYLQTVLGDVLEVPNSKILNIKFSSGTNEVDNFSHIIRIQVQYLHQKELKDFSVIAKLLGESKFNDAFNEELDVWRNESGFFSYLIRKLKDSIKGEVEIYNIAPKCYYVDFFKRAIFLEDLSEKNYLSKPRTQFLSLDEALLTVKSLATLHGASHKVLQEDASYKHVYKHHLYNSKPSELLNIFFENTFRAIDANFNMLRTKSRKGTCQLFALKSMIKYYLEECKVCDIQKNGLNFLLHGDIWKNNVLFHYTDGVVDDAILIDYQLITYNSFANDLNYFLFSSVDAKTIVENLDIILEHYFKQLKAISPEIPNLTFKRIKEEFHERLFFGYIIFITFRSYVMYSDVKPNMEKIYEGELYGLGFRTPKFLDDLNIFMDFFDKNGLFDGLSSSGGEQ